MKRKVNKLIIPILVMLIPIMLFALPIFNGRTAYSVLTYKDEYYASLSSERQALYDKLIIKNVEITERKTGTASFDTETGSSIENGSVLSNMEGIDVSEKDDYVRTFDIVSYTIEVNIDKNSNANIGEDEILKGGVIKVKATIPHGAKNEVYGRWEQDAWMSNVNFSDNGSTIIAEYHIPNDQSLVGGNQQLTFSFKTTGYNAKLEDELSKTKFEVWMEGNQPDNTNSLVESVNIIDEKLYISGKESFELELKTGDLSYQTTLDGVQGNLTNYTLTMAAYHDLKGKLYPSSENFEGKIKIEVYYKDLTDTTNKWIKIEEGTPSSDKLLSGIKLIAYNAPTEINDNAKPEKYSNSNGDMYMLNYLPVTLYPSYNISSANIENNILSFEVTNYLLDVKPNDKYTYTHNSYSNEHILFSANFEIFIPYYENQESYYYQVKATATDFVIKENSDDISVLPDTNESNNTATTQLKKYVENAIKTKMNFQQLYRSSIINTENITLGVEGRIESEIQGTYVNYLGGVTRLLTWNPSYFSYKSISKNQNETIKYGIYKSNPTSGLSTTSEINSTNINDFNWYTSLDDARKNGTITALLLDNRVWTGYNEKTDYTASFNTVMNPDNIYDVTHFRQKIYLYYDVERTIFDELYASDADDSYIPTKYENLVATELETPDGAGETVLIYGDTTSASIITVEKSESGSYKTNYDVIDDVINFEINAFLDPNLYGNNIFLTDDVEILLTLDKGLKFIESSSSIKPEYIHELDDKTYVFWLLEECTIGNKIETISFSTEIDQFAENNTTLYARVETFAANYSAKTSESSHTYNGEKFHNYHNSYGSVKIKLSNLSGSTIRKRVSFKNIDANGNVEISDTLYNVSDDTLNNIKTIQRLPKNNDINGSKFNGTYNLELLSKEENQKIYYTTKKISELNIAEDAYGNLSAANIDFSTDSNWIEVNIGETIPEETTFIGTYTKSIYTKNSKSYSFKFKTNNNQPHDKYIFRVFMTSDNLSTVAVSAYKDITVGDRVLSGFVFIDKNENNYFDKEDKLYNGYKINLLDENKNILQTTTTNENGVYEFINLSKGNYYVQIDSNEYHNIITKNASLANLSNVFNTDGYTDLISELNDELRAEVFEVDNINLGLVAKKGTLTVHHYIDGTTTPLAQSYTSTLLWGDEYTTSKANVDSNYELVSMPTNASGTISGNVVVTYYYKLKTATLTVHHYIEGTKTSIVADEINTVTYTDSYQTTSSANVSPNYELASTQGTLQGIVSGNIEVIYYYRLKSSNLIIKHLEQGTNRELAPEEKKSLKYTDEYETTISPNIPGNYEYYGKTENYKGIVSTDNIEVIYYYQKKDSKLSSSVSIKAPEEITSKTQKIDYKVEYSSTINDYNGSGTITIKVNLPYRIDESKSNLNGGTYNNDLKTITWIIYEENINASSEQKEININKDFSVIYSNLLSTDRTINTSVTSNIKLENNERNSEDNQTTYIKIQGKIIVHHYIEGTTTKVIDDIETTNLVGETYVSEPIEKKGYLLKKEPESKNHIYQDEPQEIIYEYERLKFNIVTKVDGGEGIIGGDEVVFFGDDSTEGNIIIKPSKGYEVSRIIVNGEEKNIDQCKKGCVLNNFIEVYEDKEIIVMFEKIPDNPETSSSIKKITILLGLAIISIVSITLLKKIKPSIRKI